MEENVISDQALAEHMIRDPRLKVAYFIPHSPQNLEDASPFGGYTPGLQKSSAMIFAAAQCPADVREPFASAEMVINLRLRRLLWRSVIPVDIRALEKVTETKIDSLFRVVLTGDPELAQIVDRLRFQDHLPFLHVSSVQGDGRLISSEFDPDKLTQFVESVVERLAEIPESKPLAEAIRNLIQESDKREPRTVNLGSSMHNVTAPNELALTSYGCVLGSDERLISPGIAGGLGDSDAYIDRICLSADTVFSERHGLMSDLPIEILDNVYIVSVQGLFWSHYRNRLRVPKTLSQEDRKAFRTATSAIVRQSSYFDTFSSDGARSLIENSVFQSIMQSRGADLLSYTAGLSLLSTNTLTPVLRLEPKVNQTQTELRALANCVRTYSGSDLQRKASGITRRVANRMRHLIDHRFLDRIDTSADGLEISGIKIVSDIPLEFLTCNGIPLGMRFDLSRLSVTPGNLYLTQCLDQPIRIGMSKLRDILVIRSYESGDALTPFLEGMIRRTVSGIENAETQIRFVDVQSVDEMIEALEGFTGGILIFDGHGSYEDQFGIGTFVIGGHAIDIWGLRDKCEFPPIVIFSACDTHPLDGSHSSIANAAFLLGAKTVLATSLPIDGALASVFIGRLILRIHNFVPIALRLREILTWREVVSGLLRMSYSTEITRLLRLHSKLPLTQEAQDRVHFAANTAINARQANWYETYLENLSYESGVGYRSLQKQVDRWASLTDAMKYVQIGSPENILITDDSSDE